MFTEKLFEFEINGVKASFSSGKFARKSQSAVMARMGDTVVLATVNVGEPLADADYFPMSIEYMEKMYAAGKISGSKFRKRDGFPSDDAILNGRIIDRSVRSRFPADYRNEVQIIVQVMSFDGENDPMILATNAVSAALMISSAPFNGPVSLVRVGIDEGNLVPLNKFVSRDESLDGLVMNFVVAGDGKSFTNIDANSREVPEDKIIETMEYALGLMNPWLEAQQSFASQFEVVKAEYASFALPEELVNSMKDEFGDRIAATLLNDSADKNSILEEAFAKFEGVYSKKQMVEAYEKIAKLEMRKYVLKENKRIDGRALDEVRELDFQVGMLPRVHGSGMFTRGMTQVMTIATLGTTRSQQLIDDMTGADERRYLHFYSDGPYSFGQASRIKFMPGRREIGHGALGEKALYPVLPSMEDFPYTILLVSEILSENGSSSMASATASSMALMDAGVPITRPVAGIALGLIMDEENGDFKVLTDIRDVEDFYGYMDFKVTGTTEGVTAVQMDTKSEGLSIEVFKAAIEQAKKARFEILDGMVKVIPAPKSEVSKYAPKVSIKKIPVDKIGELIGPGGKNIKQLIEDTGADFNIEDDGTVQIFAVDAESMAKAEKAIADFSFVPVVGEIYEGKVKNLAQFGAFVEIAKGVDGLVHVSEIKDGFVKDVSEFVKEGDMVKVKVLGIDEKGKIKLSMKQV